MPQQHQQHVVGGTPIAMVSPASASSSTDNKQQSVTNSRFWLLQYVYHRDVLTLRAPHRALHLSLSDQARQRGQVWPSSPLFSSSLPYVR
jgi:hypothetical protein